MAAKLNFVNIMVYLWIFCLYILISKIILGIIWVIIEFTYIFKDTKNYSISYNSPVMGPLANGYDIITAGPMMVIWAGLFFIITVIILFLMIIWLILGGFPFFLKEVSPFKELTPIFKAILNRIPFKQVFNRYSRELTSILQDSMKKYRERSFEKFTDKKVIENFSSIKEYIDDDFYNDIGNYYKMKDNYYIGAYKSYKHSDEALLYKTYKIITPDMDDNEVSGVISENNTVAGKISSQSMISKKFKI
jgi:hypothetical protein